MDRFDILPSTYIYITDVTLMLVLVSVSVMLFYGIIGEFRCWYYLLMTAIGLSVVGMRGGFVTVVGTTREAVRTWLEYGLLAAGVIVFLNWLIFVFSPSYQVSAASDVFLILAFATAEEIFFRGALFNLQLAMGPPTPGYQMFSIVVNSIIFSFFHYWVSASMFLVLRWMAHVWIFIGGCILCFLVLVTRRLESAILAHTIVNILAYIR